MLRRPAPATAISLVALFFSLSGAAFAANHYIINSRSQINPKVLKTLKGKTGKTGPRGAKGAVGATGATGAAGAIGAAGPFPETLPSGKTLRGAFNIGGTAAAAGDLANTSISFIYTLAAPPTVKLVLQGAVAPAECPGNATLPQAQPGFLCVYEESRTNTTGVLLNGVTRSGATIYVNSTAAGGFFSFGAWAATAA